MEWLPEMKLGLLNGWLMLGSFYLVFGILMLLFPRAIVAKLFSVSGWSREQQILSAAGKPFSLACLGLLIFTPLKIGQGVFVVGSVLFLFGFAGMMMALFNFRNTPADQPVNQGLYRISRNPQWLTLATMFLGTCIAIGSWVAVILLLVATLFYHFRILGEERACLNRFGEPYKEYLKRVPRYFLFF
ncbi:MAG: isoprenylcysteine carboxylmethyltransferase family protein [Nanoarchaeota archaeon]|nr:isoprenylcysteine carboxylmethyltransferase family protein [Nanoarchaeota archaeon]